MACYETRLHKENTVSSHFNIFPLDQKLIQLILQSLHVMEINIGCIKC